MDNGYKGIRTGFAVLLIIGSLLVALFSGGIFGYRFASLLADPLSPSSRPSLSSPAYSPSPRPSYGPAPTFGNGSSAVIDPDNRVEDIVEAVAPSVVNVYVYTGSSNLQSSQGSGVVISSQGYIITNNHVIEDASKILISFTDGSEEEATVIGIDERSDLAVLYVEKSGLQEIKFADSDSIKVGELAVAIGNAMGNEGTVTVGIVSATKRYVQSDSAYMEMIQTDAAINPGNSGGALVNKRGELIGINTLKLTNTTDIYGQSIAVDGMGFAIPTNIVANIAKQLLETGKVTRGGLGIKGLYAKAGTFSDLPDMPTGIYVAEVVRDGSAYKAGIREDMVITKLDGQIIKGMGEFSFTLQKKAPGTNVVLEVVSPNSPNEPFTVTATLGELSE